MPGHHCVPFSFQITLYLGDCSSHSIVEDTCPAARLSPQLLGDPLRLGPLRAFLVGHD